MGILNQKKILITGVATNRSIATGIAYAMYHEGAEPSYLLLINLIRICKNVYELRV